MLKYLCYLIFKIQGWTYKESIPQDLRSFVMVGAPHTSNWDFIPAMAVSYKMNRNAHFVIKHSWMRFPLKTFFKSLGAIGINRKDIGSGKIKSSTDLFAKLFENKEFVLMISPEGTRKKNAKWKTGFYHIAKKAQVPIVLGYDDYVKKEAGLGMVIYPDNFEEDMQKINDFYKDKRGHRPQNFLLHDLN